MDLVVVQHLMLQSGQTREVVLRVEEEAATTGPLLFSYEERQPFTTGEWRSEATCFFFLRPPRSP